MATDGEENTGAIDLGEVLDLTAASKIATAILEKRGENVELDASRVTRVGAQCIQVLLSAEQTWRADGNSLTVTAHSDEFEQGLSTLGFSLSLFVDQEAA